MFIKPDKLRSFLNCSGLRYTAEDGQKFNKTIKKRREIYRLILEFSFLPQLIAATALYMFVKGESAVLLDPLTGNMYFIVFLQIFIFSFFTLPKRFYPLRIFPAIAYLELIAAGFISGYVNAWLRFFLLAFFGLSIIALNLCALYGWKNLPDFKNINVTEIISDNVSKDD